MQVASQVLPVFAIIVTGWLAGWLGYISRLLADALVQFAYNVAMPALLVVIIAQEPARNLLEWRFHALVGRDAPGLALRPFTDDGVCKLARDPEKCAAVFPRGKRGTRLREDHAQSRIWSAMMIHPDIIALQGSQETKNLSESTLQGECHAQDETVSPRRS